MPIVRVDVPEGHPMENLLDLRNRVERAIARSWAKDHIYVAVREMVGPGDDSTAIVTVDLRPGRGQEEQRSAALYKDVLRALQACVGTDPDRFVLLVREFPERCFVVDGGQSLPPLGEITPALDSPSR